MGLDLTVVLADGVGWDARSVESVRELFGTVLGYSRLSFSRDYTIFAALGRRGDSETPKVCPVHPLNMDLHWYSDEGMSARTEDPYGDALTYALAGEMVEAIDACVEADDTEPSLNNRAIIEWLRALPYNAGVILWWH